MCRLFSLIMAIALTAAASAKAANVVSVTGEGWTVTADGNQEVLSVSREGLGTVLKGVQLNLRDGHGLQRFKRWSVEKQGEKVSIRVSEPPARWVFEPDAEVLRISTTAAEGVLTAEAPAAADRIVARLLDPQGTPVNWMMTEETKQEYGGIEATTPSFLPRRNPDVMYFALGQVASSNLHSLFDRKSDTVIEFPEQTVMQREGQDADLLNLIIPVPGNTSVRVMPEYFTKILGLPYYVPFDDSYFSRPPMVWDSWSSYYNHIREEDIVRNADWIAANLKPYGFQYVQLDAGYDIGKNGEHYWIENWDKEKFPHGPKWLTNQIKSKGLLPGLWLVPNAYAGAVEQHPEWYLRYKSGVEIHHQYESGNVPPQYDEPNLKRKRDDGIVLDYTTPTLDSTNPEVLDFLKKEFTILDNFGFEYYKFDGEHDFLKYVPNVDLDKIADKSVDPLVAYRHRLEVIRDTVGPHRFIEGCPAGTPLNGIGYFNSYYTGEDPYNSWLGMYSVFSSINANAFLNHVAVYIMPGEMDVEPPMSVAEALKRRPPEVVETDRTRENSLSGFGTTLAEARTVVSHVALSGTVYSLGSVMPELPQERVRLLKMTLPTMPILPIDLFSRGTDAPLWDFFKHTTTDDYIHNYPEIMDLKVNAPSGVYDVAGLTNWRGATTTRQLSFADKLGLNPDASYVVFDFWGQKVLGVFKGQMDVSIDPHDTRVLLIHSVLNRPQLVGTSRHITGAYSIKELAWDGSQNRLRGTSDTVAGEDYTLWFYIPDGVRVARTRVTSAGKSDITARHEKSGNSLILSFPGQHQPVNWEIEFSGQFSK